MGKFEYRVKVRRGRITLPKAIRETLGIRDGDELIIKAENGEIIIKSVSSMDIEEFDKNQRTFRSY
ncbi:MAG: AbrB/MazE/SpoVT family DNA-binding domain-containing protein [Vulcanisaeta sp.]|jgi:AbrB family looped-hinge helix DNA binding protein|uniref:AbrB/MazE/SpoVT family DNA-binding domain-containing protein n=1 Tax=Vulcanisaeta sp. TaxID=2020871 RepID=UPI003D0B5471